MTNISYTETGVYNVKNGTKVIADYAFFTCDNLSSIAIPNSVINIGKGNDVITMHKSNAEDYSHLILLIVLAGLAVGAAVFFIIRRSVKKHKNDLSK